MKEVKMVIGLKFLKEGREWRLLGLLYVDHLVLCGESEGDLKVMLECLFEVCMRSLKVNANMNKLIVLVGRRNWSVRFMWMGHNWSKCHSSNIQGVFWMNQVQMLVS